MCAIDPAALCGKSLMTNEQWAQFKIGLVKGFTTKQHAGVCGVSERTVRRWRAKITTDKRRTTKWIVS